MIRLLAMLLVVVSAASQADTYGVTQGYGEGDGGLVIAARRFNENVSFDATITVLWPSISLEAAGGDKSFANLYVGYGFYNYAQFQLGYGTSGYAYRVKSELFLSSLFPTRKKHFIRSFSYPLRGASWYDHLSLSMALAHYHASGETHFQLGFGLAM